MGHTRHNAIIVTSWDAKALKEAHEKAKGIFPSVSSITTQQCNGYASFLVPPDGSKEGWGESENGDRHRLEFISWMAIRQYDGHSNLTWVEVQYGDDDGDDRVIQTDTGIERAFQ